MEQFPQSSPRGPRRAPDNQAPHERPRTDRSTGESRHAAGSHRAPANKGTHTNSAAKERATARPKSRYIPALDGLRTLAVVAVVLYHLNLTWAQGGLLGVTIFFGYAWSSLQSLADVLYCQWLLSLEPNTL